VTSWEKETMSREDIERLLGGYATNSLTEEERRELFEAALTDQALFDGLADEHALKELLDDPRARRVLIEALKNRQERHAWYNKLHTRLGHPSAWALAGSVAVALLAVTLVIRLGDRFPEPSGTADTKGPIEPAPLTVPESTESLSKAPPKAGKTQEPPAAETKDTDVRSTDQARSPSSERRNQSIAKTPNPPSDKEELNSQAGGASKTVPAPAEPPKQEQDELYIKTDKPASEPAAQEFFGKSRDETKALSPMAGAQGKPESLRREALKKTQPATPGILYTLLQERADGTVTAVDAATTIFRTGDKARLAIEPNDKGYLYVMAVDAAGNSKMIFPAEQTAGAAMVDQGARYLVPPVDPLNFQTPGDWHVTMIFSREPLTNRQALLESRMPELTAKTMDRLGRQSPSVTRIELTLKHQ
jgi:uncharacterized protein DUF4384